VTIGDVICYEVAYDDIVHDAIVGGGQVLVVQTNNATYMGTHQPDQQWAITQLRAVEHGRSTLVAATTGISGWITPDGEAVQTLPLMRSDSFVGAIPLRNTLTLSDRLSYWPEYLASLAALGAAVWAVVTQRRLRRDAALDSLVNPEEEPIA
jgi:apolipoprotein N-acyltransferase